MYVFSSDELLYLGELYLRIDLIDVLLISLKLPCPVVISGYGELEMWLVQTQMCCVKCTRFQRLNAKKSVSFYTDTY